MPWHTVKDHTECGEGKWAVVKDDGGEVEGCHMSEEDANKQMAALYANTGDVHRAKMSTGDINDLPDSAFAYVEPGGEKDEQGKTVPRSKRHFPIHDVAHVRNALARAPQSPFGDKAMPKIRRAAKKFGIEVSDDGRSADVEGEFRRVLPSTQTRAFDFELRSVGGDGRTLEGYVAVFGAVARIADYQGDFDEEIHRGAFDRSLERSLPVMQFDHGRDPRTGTVPIGVYDVFEPDDHGYHVRGRLFDNPVVEPVRQAIAGKAIRGMSWKMLVTPKTGDRWTTRSGQPDKRDVLDADVPEAGPVVFPAYDATAVSVRSVLAGFSPEERRALVHELAAEVRLAVDLSSRRRRRPPQKETTPDLTVEPGARGAGGGEFDPQPGSGEASALSEVELRTRHRVLVALGVLNG